MDFSSPMTFIPNYRALHRSLTWTWYHSLGMICNLRCCSSWELFCTSLLRATVLYCSFIINSTIEIRNNNKVTQDEGKNLIDRARSRLTECLTNNKRLSGEIETLHLQRGTLLWKDWLHLLIDHATIHLTPMIGDFLTRVNEGVVHGKDHLKIYIV